MFKNLPTYLANARKALINITGLAGALLALGLLPAEWAPIASTVIGVLTAITHYLTPNAPAPGNGAAVESFGPEDADSGAEVPAEEPAELTPASEVASDNEIAAPPGSVTAVESSTSNS